MDEVKKLFASRKTSQKELGDTPSPDSTTSRWRRRSQSRGRTISGQKSKNFDTSPYDAQPPGESPTQGAEPIHGNASSGARNRNSMKSAPSLPHPFPAPSSGQSEMECWDDDADTDATCAGTAAPTDSIRPLSGAIPSGSTDGPLPKTPNNRSSYQQQVPSEQRSPTLPIAEQFSQSSYYDRNSTEANSNVPSVAAQTRRRELPVRTANGDSGMNQASSFSPSSIDKQNHLVGPRSQPGRGNVSPSRDFNGSIDLPKRSGRGSDVDGYGTSGSAGGNRQLSTGSLANGTIQKGPYTKPGTASAGMPSASTTRSTSNNPANSANYSAASNGNYSAEGKRYVVEGAAQAPSLEGIVDLRNTTQTTVHTTWAAPVVHERIMPKIHHVTHPVIERRIHNHEVHHRMLPIIDVQVLPAKHYAPHGPGGSLIEIGSAELPGRMGANQHWVVAETVSKMGSVEQDAAHGPGRSFSARPYAVSNDEPKAYTGANGVPTTEQTWVHSPTMHEGARATGQTEALQFGEPRADGVFHERPEMQSRRERDAEEVVAADSAQRMANGPNSRLQSANVAHMQKSKPQREQEAEKSIVGGRAAPQGVFGHRGM